MALSAHRDSDTKKPP